MTIKDISELILALTAIIGGFIATLQFYRKRIKPIMQLADKINAIYMEIKPNHGTSIKDAINRIEKRQLTFEQRIKAIQTDYEYGIFETNAEGECIYINRTYQQLTGRSLEDCKGNGWILALHPDDRMNVIKEWELAVEQQREFNLEYRFINDGDIIPVKVSAFPIFNNFGDGVFGFTGIVIRRSI